MLTPAIPDQGFPHERFILVPLDVTTPHEMPFPLYKAEVDPEFENTSFPSTPMNKPPLSHFTSAFLERTREVMLDFGKDAMELHDPVAVWFAIENPPGMESAGQSPVLQQGWRTVRRQFQVERWVSFYLIWRIALISPFIMGNRTGEFTRGMLVVDRRDDVGAYSLGDNRSMKCAPDQLHGPFGSAVVPAPVLGEEGINNGQKSDIGVFTLVETPGPQACLDLLLRRIWGISSQF